MSLLGSRPRAHAQQLFGGVMETPVAASFFRQLFYLQSLRPCTRNAASRHLVQRGHRPCLRAAGTYSNMKRKAEHKGSDQTHGLNWRPRKDLLSDGKMNEYQEAPLVTAEELRSKNRRPRRVKMWMRDFIDDSLYNPYYGYFSSQATIFDPGPDPFDFPNIASEAQFNVLLDHKYKDFEDRLDKIKHNDTRQLWHTPTELFRPHYAEAMARYLVENYKISLYPYHDLIIYELGAGNGTFMLNVLDWIREMEPRVYERTRYKIVEISASLAQRQTRRANETRSMTSNNSNMLLDDEEAPEQPLAPTAAERVLTSSSHAPHVEIINSSILQWQTYVPEPCFVVAMEVIDNLGHDAVRYDRKTKQPHQSMVLIDVQGDFYEFWTPTLDPLARRYFRTRDAACAGDAYGEKINVPSPLDKGMRGFHPLKTLRNRLFKGEHTAVASLSEPEYIPTRLLQFFEVLSDYFPAHKLLLSDFDSLPDSVPGLNAPVVQTRYQRQTVNVTTPLVRQGYFDIFFPTDFAVMEGMYRSVTGRLSRTMRQEEFLGRWAYTDETRTRNGENPLLSWYRNASVMITV